MNMRSIYLTGLMALGLMIANVDAHAAGPQVEQGIIGAFPTENNYYGPDGHILVERFQDKTFKGAVWCRIVRPVKGDPRNWTTIPKTNVSLSCRQYGKVDTWKYAKPGKVVYKRLLSKSPKKYLKVRRVFDRELQTISYVAVIDGSPSTSVSDVPIRNHLFSY